MKKKTSVMRIAAPSEPSITGPLRTVHAAPSRKAATTTVNTSQPAKPKTGTNPGSYRKLMGM